MLNMVQQTYFCEQFCCGEPTVKFTAAILNLQLNLLWRFHVPMSIKCISYLVRRSSYTYLFKRYLESKLCINFRIYSLFLMKTAHLHINSDCPFVYPLFLCATNYILSSLFNSVQIFIFSTTKNIIHTVRSL